MGGLSKKAYELSRIRKQKNEVLALDSGALLFRDSSIPGGEFRQQKISASVISAAYSLMNFAAVGIAGPDLAGGIDFLLGLQKEASFPWLSANLVERGSGRPYFKGRTTVKAGGIKIGLIGLTGGLDKTEEKVVLLPWEKVLPGEIASLGGEAEMLILLSSLDRTTNKKIALAHPEIHLILQSGNRGGNLLPERVGNALITQGEPQGKSLGVLEIYWDTQGKKWQERSQVDILLEKKIQLDRLVWQIGRYQKQGDPALVFIAQPEALTTYQNLLDRREGLEKEIAELSAGRGHKFAEDSTFTCHFIPLGEGIPDEPSVRAIVEASAEEINRLGRLAASEKKNGLSGVSQAGYAGSISCRGCHTRQYEKWQTSKHATAYRTLGEKKQQFNSRCLPCHVTGGLGQPEEILLRLTDDLRKVGCESCHGPAARHAGKPENHRAKQPAQAVCLSCHDSEHHAKFSFQEALSRLGCK